MATNLQPGTRIWYGVPWTKRAATVSITFDVFVAIILFLAVTAAFQIHFILLAGDWDFWVDWKDRQWYPVVFPVVCIMFPAALQNIFWVNFRLPLAATFAAVVLVLAEWFARWQGFHLWSQFPYSMVWPSTWIASALVLDIVLVLSGNFVITAALGASAFAILFYPSNWPMLAAYHLPMEVMGSMVSVADYIGYSFTRTATPEYIRLIERGTLRTFGGESTTIAAFFAGFACSLTYFVWWYFGAFMTKMTTFSNGLKRYMGLKDENRKPVPTIV